MPLPPVELYTNLSRVPTQQCSGNHPSSPRQVKAAFAPAYCFMHGNNQDPACGWAYITRDEAHLLSIARRNIWTAEALEEMIARDLEVGMNAVAIEETTDEEEETKEAELAA
ncbi:hypothetical protein PHYPSEUDO_015189 [Phytophthora pseudosyringae]|uniref:Uncharacterized protein n=1 Tax=Phytophthora pseudosyringae TaxID=221518 RepID=A0A8T1V3G8_9STRA|nr:hypothetical protein PHYPSEUDO_015189 [Phytophthora pseudosyringae]